jgi:hypothetical protein
MLYKDLNLKLIREECGLDFAHYTYRKGQCTCCYGPSDLAARYWKDHKVRQDRDFTYILFKHASNSSGIVKGTDNLKDRIFIAYRVKSMEQLIKICEMLQKQLGENYTVEVPKSFDTCIIINKKGNDLMNQDVFKELG